MVVRKHRVIAWDTETYRIAPGMAAPRMVCLSYDDGERTGVVLREEGLKLFRKWVRDPWVILVAHHAPYDLGVVAAEDPDLLPDIFQAIDEGRIRCTKLREQMIENARGELKYDWDEDLEQFKKATFTLDRLVYVHFKEWLKKGDDTWRMFYGLLDGVPIEEWPEDAVEYAIKDSLWGRRVYFAQEEIIHAEGAVEIPGHVSQMQAAMALNLLRIWGVRAEAAAVDKLRTELTNVYNEQVKLAQSYGLVRIPKPNKKGVVKKPSRDMKAIKAAVAAFYTKHKLDVPLSDSGKNISTSRETLTAGRHKRLKDDPDLIPLKAVSEVVRLQKLLTTYVPILERGVRNPITPDWNAILETYRTSCASPNLQNLPRGGDVRNCFVPRPGWIFAFCDYDTLEMRTLAQTCIDLGLRDGQSDLADALRAGRDVHVAMAAEMLEISYDEALERYEAGDKLIAEARQFCKIGNYGFGGGMGPDAFVDYARGYGIEVSLEHARQLHQSFRKTWRETVEYFNFCSDLIGDGGVAETVVHPRTGLVRGQVRYTAVCNHFFQHLAAMGAKAALYQTVKECYLKDPNRDGSGPTPLYGCRVWLFAHDEIGMEIPYTGARANTAAKRLQEVMIAEMKKFCPDVPIGATVVMARRWYKGAKPANENGMLVPSKPVKNEKGKTDWVPDVGADYFEERMAA